MINASIVLYNHSLSEITPLVETLKKSSLISTIFLIDNSSEKLTDYEALGCSYIFNPKNIGYGAANNVAIRQTIKQNISYHLVVNPDVAFDPSILDKIDSFMNNNSNVGQLMPKVYYPNGEIQYLCKLIPTPFDLIFRRFLPISWTKKRIDKFEMRTSGYNKIINVPYLSGCFMFLRTSVLEEIGLFDEHFFLYPEDIDLTRRIHQKYTTVFYPDVSIIHHHAQRSYLNYRMLWIHTTNMIKYFNKWGWFFDKERKYINKKTIDQLKV
jgi:GT2 family glycosyltransferase